MMLGLVFLSSTLLGLVLGTALCVRYLRQEMTARIGPRMDLVLLKLDNMQCALNLAFANWYSELNRNTPSTSQYGDHPSVEVSAAWPSETRSGQRRARIHDRDVSEPSGRVIVRDGDRVERDHTE